MSLESFAAPALLQQVLDAYRDPLRYRKLWADPFYVLPEGVEGLLDLALASPDVLAECAQSLRVSGEELLQAVHFFIGQALLAEENNAHRILGLAPNATPTQIKSHYYKLMRLYHPDRGAGEEWRGIYATRINRAYQTLRHGNAQSAAPENRRESVRPPPRWDYSSAADWRLEEKQPPPPRRRSWVLGVAISGTAVAAGLGFIVWNLMVWPDAVQKPRWHASNKADKPYAFAPDMAAPVWPESVPVVHELEPAPKPIKRSEPAKILPTVLPPLPAPPKPTWLRAASPPPAAVSPAPTALMPEPIFDAPSPPTVEPPPSVAPPAPAEPAAQALSVPVRQPAAAPVAPPLPPPGINERELQAYILHPLQAAFRRGDIQAFIALFSEQAVSNGQVGRESIRHEYAEFFAATAQRELRLGNFHWEIDDQAAIGKGTYSLKATASEHSGLDNNLTNREGLLVLDVGKEADRLLIKGFFQGEQEAP